MDAIELGGNITLSGFSGRDFTELIVVKKMVGQYARKLSDSTPGFQSLKVVLTEHAGKHTIHTQAIVDGTPIESEETDHNLFFALDNTLKRVLAQTQN